MLAPLPLVLVRLPASAALLIIGQMMPRAPMSSARPMPAVSLAATRTKGTLFDVLLLIAPSEAASAALSLGARPC